jgi:hypothetical protein
MDPNTKDSGKKASIGSPSSQYQFKDGGVKVEH